MTNEDYLEQIAKSKGLSVTQLKMQLTAPTNVVQDIVRDLRRPARAASIADKPNAEPQRDSRPQGNGWVTPPALGPQPGSKLIDRLMDAADARDRAERGR